MPTCLRYNATVGCWQIWRCSKLTGGVTRLCMMLTPQNGSAELQCSTDTFDLHMKIDIWFWNRKITVYLQAKYRSYVLWFRIITFTKYFHRSTSMCITLSRCNIYSNVYVKEAWRHNRRIMESIWMWKWSKSFIYIYSCSRSRCTDDAMRSHAIQAVAHCLHIE